MDGGDLFSLDKSKRERLVYSESLDKLKSIRLDHRKMILDLEKSTREFYNLVEDPQEKNDLSQSKLSEHLDAKSELMSKFGEWLNMHERKQVNRVKARLDNETKKQLKALGYL
jgi:hypothetical protein